MNCAWTMILFVLYLVSFHSAHSSSLKAADNEKTISFTADMLPIVTSLTSVNSSTIQVVWHPSPSSEGINITQLEGLFSVGLYTGSQPGGPSKCIANDMNKLKKTGQTTMAILKPDTVYNACFLGKWYAKNTLIDCFNLNGLYRRDCRLVRTYMKDQKTLNPVPPFGEYTWKQVVTNISKLAIVINATLSSKLPYVKRNITVTLGSENQSRMFEAPLESVEFEFDGLRLESETYPLWITFMLVDQIDIDLFTITNTLNETVRTTAPSMGNKLLFYNSFFLVFLTVFYFVVL